MWKIEPVGPDKPALVFADEEDPLVIVDHPVAFALVAITLLPPRFATILCEENPIVCADSPATVLSNKPDTAEWKFADVFVAFPRLAAVLCVEHVGILSDDPPLIGVREVDIPERC